jgi:hypothetical protein
MEKVLTNVTDNTCDRICGTNVEYRVDAGTVLRVSTMKVKN